MEQGKENKASEDKKIGLKTIKIYSVLGMMPSHFHELSFLFPNHPIITAPFMGSEIDKV